MHTATIPGKERAPTKGHPHPTQPFRQNSITVAVKPIENIWLETRPEHDELCTIVWQNGKRLIKFINKACPYHSKVRCLTELAN